MGGIWGPERLGNRPSGPQLAREINWNILKEMGIPDHLICLLRNLYSGQEATVRTGHGTTEWFQIGKGVRQGCILSTCLFNFYAEYIMRNAGLEEAQAGIKISGRNINNLRRQRMRWLDGITDSMDVSLSELREGLLCCPIFVNV